MVSQSQPQTMTNVGVDSAFSLCGAETRSWTALGYSVGLDQNDGEDTNAAQQCHVSMSPSDFILERWLTDANGPRVISAEVLELPEQRKRALGEIDGIYAGLTYLDKLEQSDLVPGAGQGLVKDLEDMQGRWHEDRIYDCAEDIALDRFFEEAKPCPAAQELVDMARAWTGLRSLKRGMQAEFQRFQDLTSDSACPPIGKLRAQFRSYKELADRGTLVYRDVLDRLPPDTLADIFAFASLSHAISRILVSQGRMREAEILTGLQSWRNCIHGADERDAFDSLASRMWPGSHVASAQQGQPRSSDSHGRDRPIQSAGNLTENSHFLAQVANIAGAEMSGVPRNLSNTGQPADLPLILEENVLGMTDLTEQEFNFSLLRNLGGETGGHGAPKLSNDTRDVEWWCGPEQSIPGYDMPTHRPPGDTGHPEQAPPMLSCQVPPALPTQSSSSSSQPQRILEFQVTDEASDCAIRNLRNTVVFLAVFAYAKETGDSLYQFSDSGRTVAHGGTGSACASERSKAERRLRKDFFEPLKRTGADDARFLALLSVAKKFVVLGLLRTEDEVQDYLLAVSKVFFSNGTEQLEFIRWIFQTSSPASNDAPAREGKNRNLADNQRGNKRRRIYYCEHPGCESMYHSASGLSKHKKKHAGETRQIHCDKCAYSSDRRDLVRQHFIRHHGANLPPSLQETRRGYA